MRRLIWSFAGLKYHIVGNLMSRLKLNNRPSNIILSSMFEGFINHWKVKQNFDFTLLAFLQALVKIPSTQSLFWFKFPNIRSCSSTTSGLILISLCVFSDELPLLPVEPLEAPLGDMDRASTKVCIQLLLPLPGGPATITPVGNKTIEPVHVISNKVAFWHV